MFETRDGDDVKVEDTKAAAASHIFKSSTTQEAAQRNPEGRPFGGNNAEIMLNLASVQQRQDGHPGLLAQNLQALMHSFPAASSDNRNRHLSSNPNLPRGMARPLWLNVQPSRLSEVDFNERIFLDLSRHFLH
jgi:hypothetical protein